MAEYAFTFTTYRLPFLVPRHAPEAMTPVVGVMMADGVLHVFTRTVAGAWSEYAFHLPGLN